MYATPPANCYYHSSRPAVTYCMACGRPTCRSCTQADPAGRPMCRPCCLQHGVKQRRSGGVTTLAVLNIIFGGLGLLSLFWLIILLIMPPAWMGRDYALIMSIPGYRTYSMVGGIFGAGMGVFLLACGIGLLRLRDWARNGSMIYAAIAIVTVVISAVLFLAWQIPAMEAAGVSSFQVDMMRVSGFTGPVLGLVYPVVLLALLTRPMIKVQFGYRMSGGAPGGIPMPNDGIKN